MASSSSSTTMIPQKKYHVFLSFRGEDTRDNFTSHLYEALCGKHIETFIDNQLIRGDEISQSLLKAIEESYISVIIFSERYASSGWCLDELVKILECKNKNGQVVIPVFYRVDPSDVRNQTGIYRESFSKLEERFQGRLDKLQKWRIALREAASLSGFHSHVNRPESKLIKDIANEILKRMENFPFLSSDNKDQLMGVESIILEIESLLDIGSKNVYKLGIWGMGGIGKTTIATAVFNKISSYFEGSCFIHNVREESEKVGGLAKLQRKLLSTLLEGTNVKIDIRNSDFNLSRLSRKKVLIVFDDVTHLEQMETLIGSLHFGTGSRIIITTRDKHVLDVCRVDEKYKVNELVHDDALKLFCRHAFEKNDPNVGYEKLSCKVIEYAQGVPLALKVLGGFLLKRSEEEWLCEINKLKEMPHMDIQKVLKVSYDSLDDKAKNSFLDIACFFRGEDEDRVTKLLDASGFYAKIGKRVLIDKCLITISDNKITMHDLLQEMGREIVRQESVKYPGKRSRLWHHEDIYEVFEHNAGTEAIEGISLDMSKIESICLRPDCFKKMYRLRILKVYGSNINRVYIQDIELSLRELRYLHWIGYPLKSLPIRPEKLVSLEMVDSKVEQLWDGVQNLVNLKDIYLSGCRQLTKLPDLSKAQNLENLNLKDCTSLVEIHSSIQYLNKLVDLGIVDCRSLTSLPKIRSESLNLFYLSRCSNLKRLQEISSCNLETFYLYGSPIEELPSFIDCPLRRISLELTNCSRLERLPSNLFKSESLEMLILSGCSNLKRLPDFSSCNLKDFSLLGSAIEELHPSIECLSRLESLNLGNCSRLERLPSSLFNLESLQILNISGSSNLKRLPEISSCNLVKLHLNGSAIEELPSSIECLSRLKWLDLRDCPRLERLPSSLFNLESLVRLNMSGCSNLKRLPEISSYNLEALSLDGSAIEEQPPSRLKSLYLSNCSRLERLPNRLFNLESLEMLDISGCSNLKRLPEISSCNLEKLCLYGSAIEELPPSIECLSRLKRLDLRDCSRLERLPNSLFNLKSLGWLDISGCSNLKRLPEISSCNLEEFYLGGSAIEELPPSIECLSRLDKLDLTNCSWLQSLPMSLCKMKSLQHLMLSGCSNLQRLPDELGNLDALITLEVERTPMSELSLSKVFLKNLFRLHLVNLRGHEQMSFILPILLSSEGSHNLGSLSLIDCGITELPESLGQLSSLRYLCLDKNDFERIPESVISLSKLETLLLNYCERLQSLPNLPYSLQYMDANHCMSLEALSGLSSLFTIKRISLRNCLKLDADELKEIVDNALHKIQLVATARSKRQGKPYYSFRQHSFCYPGREIPEWFKYRSMGSSLTVELPPGDRFNNEFVGFAYCVIVAFQDHHQSNKHFYLNCELKLKTEDGECNVAGRFPDMQIGYGEADHVIFGNERLSRSSYDCFEKYYNNVTIFEFYVMDGRFGGMECCEVVKKCGIHLLRAQDYGESKKDGDGSSSSCEEKEPHTKRLKYTRS